MLLRHGHRLSDIGEYYYFQFMSFTLAAERQESKTRIELVADLTAVIGGMYGGKKGPNPATIHLTSLEDNFSEEDMSDGNSTQK